MFKSAKKNVEIEQQVLEDVTDEQLGQVSGGSLLNAVGLNSLVGSVSNVTALGTQTAGSVSVGGLQVQAAGFSVTTPTIVPGTLLP